MSYAVWNGPLDTVTIANGATTSTAFSMPDSAFGGIFYIPQIPASTTTLKLQIMQPKSGDVDSDVMADLTTPFITSANTYTYVTMSGMGSSSGASAIAFDASTLGAGVFKFVANNAMSSGALTINIHWRVDRERH